MDDPRCRQFFTRPYQVYHRQYEALRAVFVEGRSQKEVAESFGYAVVVAAFAKSRVSGLLAETVCSLLAQPTKFRLIEGHSVPT